MGANSCEGLPYERGAIAAEPPVGIRRCVIGTVVFERVSCTGVVCSRWAAFWREDLSERVRVKSATGTLNSDWTSVDGNGGTILAAMQAHHRLWDGDWAGGVSLSAEVKMAPGL